MMTPAQALEQFEQHASALEAHVALYGEGVGLGDAGDAYDALVALRDDAALEFAYTCRRERVFGNLPITAA